MGAPIRLQSLVIQKNPLRPLKQLARKKKLNKKNQKHQ
jgi:hypothetical protein